MSSAPDINAETYPFDVVQQLLNQAAFFNLYSRSAGCVPVQAGRGAITGFRLAEHLCRFSIVMPPPSAQTGLCASNRIGERIAGVEHCWMFVPDTYIARPDVVPPACPFDPSIAQRFVMLDGLFMLSGGTDGFRGFGTGRTAPCPCGRRDEVLIYAVGTILEGFGRFAGCDGTYTYCGSLSRDGFRGSVVLRVMDPAEAFDAETLMAPTTTEPLLEPDVTYLFLAGQKQDRTSRTNYILGGGDQVVGLDVEQQLRLMNVDCGEGADGRVRCASSIGPVIGRMTARIGFNLLNPGAPGTQAAPIPFSSYNTFTIDGTDGEPLGTFDGDGTEGRTFNMSLAGAPGQRALRFGGFGPLLNGRGRFAGLAGQMTDNSVVGIAPHAIATSYVLRVFDRDGAYRADRR
jgi:hypothetical protein